MIAAALFLLGGALLALSDSLTDPARVLVETVAILSLVFAANRISPKE